MSVKEDLKKGVQSLITASGALTGHSSKWMQLARRLYDFLLDDAGVVRVLSIHVVEHSLRCMASSRDVCTLVSPHSPPI